MLVGLVIGAGQAKHQGRHVAGILGETGDGRGAGAFVHSGLSGQCRKGRTKDRGDGRRRRRHPHEHRLSRIAGNGGHRVAVGIGKRREEGERVIRHIAEDVVAVAKGLPVRDQRGGCGGTGDRIVVSVKLARRSQRDVIGIGLQFAAGDAKAPQVERQRQEPQKHAQADPPEREDRPGLVAGEAVEKGERAPHRCLPP